MFAKEGYKFVVNGCKGSGELPIFEFDEIQYNSNMLLGTSYKEDGVVDSSIVFPYCSYDHIHVLLMPEEELKEDA